MQSTKPIQMQNSYIQTTVEGQSGNIQRIIPGNSMMPIQPTQQPVRSSNQLNTSSVPPMYTQPSSQVPIYTSTPNTTVSNYTANPTNLSPLQNISYPNQKNQSLNSRNSVYMNYPTTQTTQGSPPITQNNIYVSNISNEYDKRTAAPTTMVYNQNIIPATNIVNSGIASTVTLAPSNSAVITPSPLSRSVTTIPNQANQINRTIQNPLNPIMISPDNKADLTKNVPITTIVSSIPTISSIASSQPYPTAIQTNINKLVSTGIPTSPIKAIINSSINSKVAAKAATAAALKQENVINQNPSNLYNVNNKSNIILTQPNSSINNNKIKNSIISNQGNIDVSKPLTTTNETSAPTTTTNAINNTSILTTNTSIIPSSTDTTNTTINMINVNKEVLINSNKVNVENEKENLSKNEIINQNEIKNNNSIQKLDNNSIDNINNNNEIIKSNINNENINLVNENNEIKNNENLSIISENNEIKNNENLSTINENDEIKNNEIIKPEDVTKIDTNIEVLDSMLYNPKSKLESDELTMNTEIINALDSSKDQSNKFLKDIDSLYENNDTFKWLEDDTNWNHSNQLSQFPLPDEDKKNQKENESKDLESLNGLNTNDSSFNDNNTQLWLSDDIDYLLQSENFKV